MTCINVNKLIYNGIKNQATKEQTKEEQIERKQTANLKKHTKQFQQKKSQKNKTIIKNCGHKFSAF